MSNCHCTGKRKLGSRKKANRHASIFRCGEPSCASTKADGLERLGYRDSPLEVMAYDAEAAFIANDIFDAEQLVARKLS